jgi:hypothetical protein
MDPIFMRSDAFCKSTFIIFTRNVYAWVSYGTVDDSWDIERRRTCCDTAFDRPGTANTITADDEDHGATVLQPTRSDPRYYTYIALWLGQLCVRFRTGEWRRTCRDHHITLAYLPYLENSARSFIYRSLQTKVRKFIYWSDLLIMRPIELLFLRKCNVTSEIDNEDAFGFEHAAPEELGLISPQRLNDLLAMDRVHLTRAVTRPCPRVPGNRIEIPNPIAVKQMHKRDSKRLHFSKMVERKSADPHDITELLEHRTDGWHSLNLRLNECNVNSRSQVFPLLWYLRECLEFELGAYYFTPRDEVGMHTEQSWHCTPQTCPEKPDRVQVVGVQDEVELTVLESLQPDGSY